MMMKRIVLGGKVTTQMRLLLVLLMLILLLFSLFRCESKREEQEKYHSLKNEKYEQERYRIRQELVLLQQDVDRKLQRVDHKMDVSSSDKREELLIADRKLKSSKAKLDKAIEDLNSATDETWSHVKQAARNTSQDVRSAYHELAYDINQLLDERN